MTDEIPIHSRLAIPASELQFRASRSGGPGGQHVNTSSTKVELLWDVAGTPSLSDGQRARVLKRLANRIDNDGVLHMSESGSRSQHRNREVLTERFAELVRKALRRKKRRIPTKPTKASRERRLRSKKRRSRKKKLRKPPEPE
ncbi:MAG TPA: alternative ribosome rescue aminoacyl-tRNA hydrolase ArfB [Longimicrobiales bacterium]|nr:alternative ribosome rescue aminoacyl-tRNA hydrolase ArfB [Longimicrobiales bacterium]